MTDIDLGGRDGSERISRAAFLRRAAVTGGAFAGLPALLAACGGAEGGGAAKAAGSLTFAGFGGTTQDTIKAVFTDPFTQKTGVKVSQGGPTDYGRLKAMVQSGRIQWDVSEVDGTKVADLARQGLVEKLDYAAIPKSDLLPERVSDYGVGLFVYATLIAYDPKRNPRHPQSWAEFYDVKKFPGKRGFYKSPLASGLFESALIADGVSKEQLYPLDFDRAFAKLDTIKPHIVWWDTFAQSQQYMTQATVDFNAAVNGRMYALIKNGASVAVEWNENIQSADYVVVTKGTKARDASMKLIGSMLQPESQASFAQLTAFAPINTKAIGLVTGEVRDYIATTPEHLAAGVAVSDDFWAKALPDLEPRWQAWLVK